MDGARERRAVPKIIGDANHNALKENQQNDRHVLEQSGASGMGLATARAFAEAGAAVVLADYSQDQVDAEAKKLTTAGYKAIALGCDVGDDAQVAAMVDSTVAHFGRLDAAFNNAGVKLL